MKKIALVLGAVLTMSCNAPEDLENPGDAPDGVESEAQANTSLPAPKSVKPGSLGGICGVNYVNCPTQDTATDAFRRLERKALTSTCSAKWGKTWEGRTRSFVSKMQVGRLVNDHNGKYDLLEMSWTEKEYGKLVPDVGSYAVVLKRNGVMVANWKSSSPHDDPENFRRVKKGVDYTRGAAEALLAWYLTPGIEKVSMKAMECGQKEIAAVDEPYVCGYWQGDCWACKFSKAAAVGILGGLGAGLAVGAEVGAAFGIGAAGAGAADVLGGLLDCGKRCGAAECTKQICACFMRASTSDDEKRCYDDNMFCCNRAGGFSTMGGECFAGL